METKIRSIRIDDWTWSELNKTADKIGTTTSTLIRNAIIEKVQKIESGFIYDREPNRNIGKEIISNCSNTRNE